MSRSYCNHSEEWFLCVAESRGDTFIDCDNCPLNKDKKTSDKTVEVNKQ